MDVSKIVQNQRDFFLSRATFSVEWRKEQLKKIRDVLAKNQKRFDEVVQKDLGRGGDRETQKLIEECDYFLSHIDEWSKPEKKADEPFGEAFVYKQPLGVVLVLAPFNFPLLLAIRPTIAALGAGNTVVLKPSELTPTCSQAIKETFGQTFDETIFAIVEGDAAVAKSLLDQRYDHIFYTGNPAIGKVVMAAASKNLTPVTLELGGKCPAVVLADADITAAAKSIADAKCLNAGQVCLSVDYILTTPTVKPKLIQAISDHFKTTFDNKHGSSENYSRIVNQRHFDRVSKLIAATKGKLLYKPDDEPNREDRYIGPHIYEVDKDDALMEDEVFGPVASLLTVDSLDEAIKFINDGERPLSAYVYTQSSDNIERFMNETLAGNSAANGAMLHVASSQVPFGGVGSSGQGRYHGKYGFDTFSHEKAVVKATGSAHPLATSAK